MDGLDLTDKLRPRLIDLCISSSREDNADQLDINLDDSDGHLALPPRTAELRVWLGWDDNGLADMGSFTVDEVEHSGTPDVITLRGRSADLRSNLRAQREQSWHETTCGTIVGELAARHSLSARCHPDLSNLEIDHIDQTNESDLNFLNRLGKRYDAVATVKANALIFAPIGKGTNATGKPLPTAIITRALGDHHRWHVADRHAYRGVRAKYQDLGSGKMSDVIAGTDDGKGVKTLRHTYATKSNALRAAQSELKKLKRGAMTFEITLARGRATIYPEMHVAVSGFKPDIDGTTWIVVKANHSLNGNGFTTRLELECKPDDVDSQPEQGQE